MNKRGWIQKSIGSCCTLNMGQSPDSESYNSKEQGIPFYQGKSDFGDLYPTPRIYCTSPLKLAHKDDILISVRAPVGAVNISIEKCCIGRGLAAISPNKQQITSKYLYYFFRHIQGDLEFKGRGTTFKSINKEKLAATQISYPEDITEQQAIVRKIEALFSSLDKGVACLKKAKEQLSTYKDAVLQEAFSGNIIKESEWEYLSISKVCNEVKVGIVIKPTQYYTSKEEGIPALRTANIGDFSINDSEWVYLTQDGHQKNKKSIVHTGDVIISRSGCTGKAAVVPEDFDGYNAIDIIIAVPNPQKILSSYLCAYTNSPYGKSLINKKERGMGLKHLNVSGYSALTIPVPKTIDEQSRIVSEIETRFAACDAAEKQIEASLAKAELLRQSILKKAFSGELI